MRWKITHWVGVPCTVLVENICPTEVKLASVNLEKPELEACMCSYPTDWGKGGSGSTPPGSALNPRLRQQGNGSFFLGCEVFAPALARVLGQPFQECESTTCFLVLSNRSPM